MPAPLPIELRTRIIEAYQRNEGSFAQLAERFRVGVATVNRYVSRLRRKGTIAPDPHGGGMVAIIGVSDTEALARLVQAMPGASAEELAVEWHRRYGAKLSASAMKRTLRRFGLTYKKSLSCDRANARRSAG